MNELDRPGGYGEPFGARFGLAELPAAERTVPCLLERQARRWGAKPAVRASVPRLAYFAIPRYVELAEELPLTDNGKVRKFVLRERGVTDATWDLERSEIVLPKPSR